MTMQSPYGDYGQDETADLVRSLALSSAKLWEELFERLRRLERAQAELRELVTKIEVALPAALDGAALERGGEGGLHAALPAATFASTFEDAMANVLGAVGPAADEDGWAIPGTLSGEAAEAGSDRAPAHAFLEDPDLPYISSELAAQLGEGALPVVDGSDDGDALSVEWHHEPEPTPDWTSAPPPVWSSSAVFGVDADDPALPDVVAAPGRFDDLGAPDAPESDAAYLYGELLVDTATPPPPPPAAFHLDAPPPPAPPELLVDAPPPPPPPGFRVDAPPPELDLDAAPPPPPPGFVTDAGATPSRTTDLEIRTSAATFSSVDDAPPPPPVGFHVDAPPPPPPPGFRADTTLPPSGVVGEAVQAEASVAVAPLGHPLPRLGFGLGAEPPPPPPGYTIVRPAQPRTLDTLGGPEGAISDEEVSGVAAGDGTETAVEDGGPSGEDPEHPVVITPDFFARAGRRRY